MHKDELKIGTPCHESWDAMQPKSATERFCESCKLAVHDLTNRTEEEVRNLMKTRVGRICIRYYVRRATGEVMLGGSLLASSPAFANGAVPQLPIAEVETEVSVETETSTIPEAIEGNTEVATEGGGGTDPNAIGHGGNEPEVTIEAPDPEVYMITMGDYE